MSKILNLVRSKFIIFFLALLALVLLFFVFKKPEEKQTNLPILKKQELTQKETNSIVSVSDLEKNFPSLAEKVNVYKTEQTAISQTSALSFARELGFDQAPFVSQDIELGQIYTWSVLEKNLNIYPQQGEFFYSVDLINFPDLNQGKLNPIEDVEKIADSFVFSKIIDESQNLKPERTNSFYIRKNGPLFSKTNQDLAEFIQINYDFKLENLRVSRETPEKHALRLIIGAQNRIFKIEYFSSPEVVSLIGSYPLKTKEQILEEIKTRPKVSFLEVENKPMTTLSDLENILAINYQNLELVYLQKTESDNLYPAFLITGRAKLKTGENALVYLYILAIEDKYLSQE